MIGDVDADLYHTVDRAMLLAGHCPDPRRPFEVTMNQPGDEGGRLRVGSSLRLYAYLVRWGHRSIVALRGSAPRSAGRTLV